MLATLSGIAMFVSAFLLFALEPLVAKRILPWFGGSAAVWSTCLVFFQTALLIGYGYARVVTRYLSRNAQAALHIALLFISLALLPIGPGERWRPGPGADPSWRILEMLTVTIGLPFVVLSATNPLLQAWLARDGHTERVDQFNISFIHTGSAVYKSNPFFGVGADFLALTSGAYRTDQLTVLDMMSQVVEASRMQRPDRLPTMMRLHNQQFWFGGPLGRTSPGSLHVMAYTGCIRFENECVTKVRAARTALAVQRYQLAHAGVLPERLDDLVGEFIDAVPQDPFDGKPLRYRRYSRGFSVYGVGQDRVDDAGRKYTPEGSQYIRGSDIPFVIVR